MDALFSLAAFLLLVGIIVAIHEGGHFVMARATGMKVVEFSVGFGPVLYQKNIGKDQTRFTLRALPLGGFVKPLDQNDFSEQEWVAMPAQDKARTFQAASRWKKALMVAGGPLSNFVLAFVLLFGATAFIGQEMLPATIAEVVPDSPFAKADIKSGDSIKKINGQDMQYINDVFPTVVNTVIEGGKMTVETQDGKNHLVDFSNVDLNNLNEDISQTLGVYFKGKTGKLIAESINDGAAQIAGMQNGDIIKKIGDLEIDHAYAATRIIAANAGKELKFTMVRDGKEILLNVKPLPVEQGKKTVGKIGVRFNVENMQKLPTVTYGIIPSITKSANKVYDSSITTLVSIKKMITGDLSLKNVSGPVAMADYSGKSAKRGLFEYLAMMAAISIAVGVFNLLPVPMLDGGHLLQYAIESVTGDLSNKVLRVSQAIGMVILLGMFTLAISNDLFKYLG